MSFDKHNGFICNKIGLIVKVEDISRYTHALGNRTKTKKSIKTFSWQFLEMNLRTWDTKYKDKKWVLTKTMVLFAIK